MEKKTIGFLIKRGRKKLKLSGDNNLDRPFDNFAPPTPPAKAVTFIGVSHICINYLNRSFSSLLISSWRLESRKGYGKPLAITHGMDSSA